MRSGFSVCAVSWWTERFAHANHSSHLSHATYATSPLALCPSNSLLLCGRKERRTGELSCSSAMAAPTAAPTVLFTVSSSMASVRPLTCVIVTPTSPKAVANLSTSLGYRAGVCECAAA